MGVINCDSIEIIPEIYNSRNFMGVINDTTWTGIKISTIVEILWVL